jgi:predicted small lipoprotein YifL
MRIFTLLLCLALAGCGLKGSLYLPPAADAVPAAGGPDAVPPEQPEPAEAVEATEDVDSASNADDEP